MSLCVHFRDPAQACTCRAGVSYLKQAGGGVHNMVLRLVCIPLLNRDGIKPCEKYEPTKDHHDEPHQ
jgi:hypothetical protein